jgi:hypothetical protein
MCTRIKKNDPELHGGNALLPIIIKHTGGRRCGEKGMRNVWRRGGVEEEEAIEVNTTK